MQKSPLRRALLHVSLSGQIKISGNTFTSVDDRSCSTLYKSRRDQFNSIEKSKGQPLSHKSDFVIVLLAFVYILLPEHRDGPPHI